MKILESQEDTAMVHINDINAFVRKKIDAPRTICPGILQAFRIESGTVQVTCWRQQSNKTTRQH